MYTTVVITIAMHTYFVYDIGISLYYYQHTNIETLILFPRWLNIETNNKILTAIGKPCNWVQKMTLNTYIIRLVT